MRATRLFLLLQFLSLLSAAQNVSITVSAVVKDTNTQATIPYANATLKGARDKRFITGVVTNGEGRFALVGLLPGNYLLEVSVVGYRTASQPLLLGTLNPVYDLGTFYLTPDAKDLDSVVVSGMAPNGVSARMDKIVFTLADNVSQSGGSVLQAMSNLPGVTLSQDGKIQLRGSDKIAVLIDGRQTALTGFDNQTGLDNIPASAIERIEIINNPSAKHDANGNAGIINIIFKKTQQEGWNGKVGLSAGLGALWQKRENLPGLRPQYQRTPKVNPTLSLNHRKGKWNTFLQADWLYTQTLNRNEFSTRYYDNGEVILQQVKRNRNTSYATAKMGVDYHPNAQNSLTLSGLFNREKIIDRGDIPYFNKVLSNRYRLWQFLEDEVKYTATASATYVHRYKQPGRLLNAGFNYTWHREDERYFFTDIRDTYTGNDAFKLLSDEHVYDATLDYVQPLRRGRLEAGVKWRIRDIPIDMQFFPGINSPIDTGAGGFARYRENIPALYGNYVFEHKRFELEAGLRLEYVRVDYAVNPNHNTYQSDGYTYTQPFPNLRLGWKLKDSQKISLFYNRRVDRPAEVDIRIFPKYDEPELLKVGNPALRPQYTNTLEAGFKNTWRNGSLYTALYHRTTQGTITRIATQAPGSPILYNVFQNAGRSYNAGAEVVWQQKPVAWLSILASVNVYQNTIDAFTVTNKYPVPSVFAAQKEDAISGNFKLVSTMRFGKGYDLQLSSVYLAPDIIPQGKIGARYALDAGLKKSVQHGRGEILFNASDLLNTMNVRRRINGTGFRYDATDYLETQVVRVGYSYKL